MNRHEYEEQVLSDCKDWIDENHEYYSSFESARDDMELAVTGNDNGSYYCNSYKAEQAVGGVIFDSSISDLLQFHLGVEGGIPTHRGAETADVYVRIAIFYELSNEIESYFDEVKEALYV